MESCHKMFCSLLSFVGGGIDSQWIRSIQRQEYWIRSCMHLHLESWSILESTIHGGQHVCVVMSVQIAGHAGFAGRIVDRIKALAGVGGGLAIRYDTHITIHYTFCFSFRHVWLYSLRMLQSCRLGPWKVLCQGQLPKRTHWQSWRTNFDSNVWRWSFESRMFQVTWQLGDWRTHDAFSYRFKMNWNEGEGVWLPILWWSVGKHLECVKTHLIILIHSRSPFHTSRMTRFGKC